MMELEVPCSEHLMATLYGYRSLGTWTLVNMENWAARLAGARGTTLLFMLIRPVPFLPLIPVQLVTARPTIVRLDMPSTAHVITTPGAPALMDVIQADKGPRTGTPTSTPGLGPNSMTPLERTLVLLLAHLATSAGRRLPKQKLMFLYMPPCALVNALLVVENFDTLLDLVYYMLLLSRQATPIRCALTPCSPTLV